MIPSSQISSSDERFESDAMSEDDAFLALRQMLLGDEKDQLEQLQERLDDPELSARDVSRVLVEAIRIRSTQDAHFADVLAPTINDAFCTSVRREPRTVVDAISPIMGPAIRHSIVRTIRGMIQSLNQTLERCVSWRSILWRLEAWRSGKSFAEVVLLRTLLYRVEQVFLIHRESGLLMQHASSDSASIKDTDLVAGMLTAIQDFVRDSFGGTEEDSLETMHAGDRTVWIEHGPQAVLAVVFHGEAPEELRQTIQQALESVHVEQQEAVASFDGDTTPFEQSRVHLETCLQQQNREEAFGKFPTKAIAALGLLVAIVLFAFGNWMFVSARRHREWKDYVRRLDDESGIVVTTAEERDGKYHVMGLHDPLACDPKAVSKPAWFGPDDVIHRWEPYQSSEQPIVEKRVGLILQPPQTVALQLNDGILRLTGSASQDWIEDAKRLARSIPGVTKADTTKLRNIDQRWAKYIEELRSETGVVVTSAEKRDNRYYVCGLYDLLARRPEAILQETSLDPKDVDGRWEIYQSLEPPIVLRRAEHMLAPPSTVKLKLGKNALHISGLASHKWITDTIRRAPKLPGIASINVSQLIDIDLQKLLELTQIVEKQQLYFVSGTSNLHSHSQKSLQLALSNVTDLQSAAELADKQVRIRLTGHAAAPGSTAFLQYVSQERVEYVKALLIAEGVSASIIESRFVGATQPAKNGDTPADYAANRRVTFQVVRMDELK